MNVARLNRPVERRLVFVWDGTDRFISSANRFVELLRPSTIYPVRALPNESIYNYGSTRFTTNEKPRAAERLEKEYRKQTSYTPRLNQCNLELLFGDRIDQIVLLAAQRQANFILMPRFIQSTFSKWLHGDLNEKIRSKATCPVIFLDEMPVECVSFGDVSAGYHREQS